jgi:HK97 family phage prohead protease
VELKQLSLDAVEVKFGADRTFTGYASVFNGVDSYGDTILPGAYADTIKNRARPIRMRWNHHGPVIGKWTDVVEDGKGLVVTGELTPGHSVAEDVYAGLKHGSLDGLSIGYRIPPGGSQKEGKVRQLKRIDLIEISVVEEPADLAARVADVKSAIEEAQSLKEIEARLRDGFGLSWDAATALVSRVKFLALRDGDAEAKRTAALAEAFQQFRPPM